MTAVVDRDARDLLASHIRRYLNDEVSSFGFDEAIFGIVSFDQTVGHIVASLWMCYDDLKDHKVVLSKPEWDYIQSLLLILDSDRHIQTKSLPSGWGLREQLATISLFVLLTSLWMFGLGWVSLVAFIFCGVVSVLLPCWHRTRDSQRSDVSPFASFAELRATYREVASFRKQPYRTELQDRRIRPGLLGTAINIDMTYLGCVLFSPILLLAQALPDRQSTTRGVPAREK